LRQLDDAEGRPPSKICPMVAMSRPPIQVGMMGLSRIDQRKMMQGLPMRRDLAALKSALGWRPRAG